MSTPFQNIYPLFMQNIQDRELVDNLTEDELEETLQMYLLQAAMTEFPYCIKDLNKIDLKMRCFLEDLDYEEMIILSYGMIIKYLEPKINCSEFFRLELQDRDFKLTGKDKILDIAIKRKNDARKQLREYVLNYQYKHYGVD